MPQHVDETSIVAGIHAVEALLRSAPGKINHLVLLRGGQHRKLHELQKLAEDQDIRTHQLPKPKLDQWFPGQHQGVLAFCNARPWDDWNAVRENLLAALGGVRAPHVVVPAAMEDPRNLGACIRSAVALGADAVLSHKKGNAGLTPTAAKAAAGALEEIPISQVGDIEKELKGLKDAGFSVVGLEASAQVELHQADLSGPMVFVVGGEDRGIPPHILRCCTRFVRIPMAGGAHSYNASVALSLLLYEANRQSGFQRLVGTDRPENSRSPAGAEPKSPKLPE